MEFKHQDDDIQKLLEYIILLLLGNTSDDKITALHLQKEVFLIQNFDPNISRDFFNFIKNYKGPFSRRVHETIRSPIFLVDCWRYQKPKGYDKLTGGFISITNQGKKEYEDILIAIKESNQENLLHLISATKILNDLYSKLNPEEILLLIYDAYPKYTEKSNVYYQLNNKRKTIAKQLYQKGYINLDKCRSLSEDNNEINRRRY